MSGNLSRGIATLLIVLLLGVGLLCATMQATSSSVLTHQLCVGVHAGKVWVVWNSPIRSYIPEVMLQPSTRCVRVPSGPFVFTTGEVAFPP